MLHAQSPVPAFSVPDENGNLVTDASLKGSWSILYFYPKDETPGCTVQACSLRDAFDDIRALGVTVYGISKDSVKSHQKFKANHRLPFTLLADTDHSMADAFGVWVEKSMYGKKYMGMDRSTFIVNPEGIIAAAFERVSPEGHADFLLEKLRLLFA